MGLDLVRIDLVSWEVRKALTNQVMMSAIIELGKGIVGAADFAAAITSFSQEVLRRWAYAHNLTALDQYLAHLMAELFTQMELSSKREKACVNSNAILA